RDPYQRPGNVRRHAHRRLLGSGARAPAEGQWSDHGRDRSGEANRDARALSSAREPPARHRLRRDRTDMSAAPLFDVAERMILSPSGLDEGRLSSVLGTVMSRGVDYADLYFQLSREESWSLEVGIVKEGSHSIEQGGGVRAIS